MTMPNERAEAVLKTHEFLRDLLDPKKTPKVPSAVRKQASRCLRHYPSEYHITRAKELSPEVWGAHEKLDDFWGSLNLGIRK